MTEMTLSQLIGLTAPVLFLYAYAMITLGRWSPDSLRYQMLNFLGAIAILISLTTQWNLPVFILELCWGVISMYGIVKVLRKRSNKTRIGRVIVYGVIVLLAVVATMAFAFVQNGKFDRAAWDKAEVSGHKHKKRCRMADDLIRNHLVIGKTTKQEALTLIGEEDASEIKDYDCKNALTYYLGFCSLMDGHTLDLCFDANDTLTAARNLQH
jgi:hypothetical protein